MTSGQRRIETEFEVLVVEGGEAKAVNQPIAIEVPAAFVINGRDVATSMVTPEYLREYTVGRLFTAGIIDTADDLVGYRCDEATWSLHVETAREVDASLLGSRTHAGLLGGAAVPHQALEPGNAPLPPGPTIGAGDLVACMRWLLSASETFFATHGVHSAALSLGGALPSLFIDDVGRHNAVDKIIGHGLLGGIDFSKCALLTTGRTPAEILFKAQRAGIPFVLSRGAPTNHTILLARRMGITVASSGRSGGLTVYSGAQRVRTSGAPSNAPAE